MRRIAVWDDINKQTIELITNHTEWAASTIAELIKAAGRWKYFSGHKAIASHKILYGNQRKCGYDSNLDCPDYHSCFKSIKSNGKFGWHLSNLVAFIRLNLFVKIELQLWLDKPFDEPPKSNDQPIIQVLLF